MKNFYSSIRNFLPSKKEIRKAISQFSKKEYFVFIGFLIIFAVSSLLILQNVNRSFMVDVPMKGGKISEGIVGAPRFINPVIATTPQDEDLVSLVYSGLMRKNTEGKLISDLASKYEVSKDGLTYTFTLKDDLFFHDDEPVNADDVVFTVNQIKDPVIKSPLKGSWNGVTAEKIDDKTVKFSLKQPYSSFLENTTLGIMPEHIWNNSPIELNEANTMPIGSGPYKIEDYEKESGGLIDRYTLSSFDKFILGEPFIETLTLRFYPSENDQIAALLNGEVDQISSISPTNALILESKGYRIESMTLPRVFGLFFNQSQNQIFTDKNIKTAIDLAIDKERIVRDVLLGHGTSIESPIPSIINFEKLNKDNNVYSHEDEIKKAESLLNKSGWKKGPNGFLEKTIIEKKTKKTINIEFTVSTSNTFELKKSAEFIKEDLEKIGMKVDVKTFDSGNLNQGVIRPRKYDVLLFGQIINHESDLFAFWHSSQRKDPGLNVAMYTNAKVDKILEDAFVTTDEKTRIKKYAEFESEVKKDVPAVFLYSPNFIYIVSKHLKGFSMDNIASPEDRFSGSYLWYTALDYVWKIFSKN